jgi:hypothetical protein
MRGRAFLTGVAVAVTFVLTPASASAASDPDSSGRLVRPERSFGGVDGGDVTGEGWRSSLSTPADRLRPRCLRLGRDRAALLALPGEEPPACRVGAGTAIYVLGLTYVCVHPVADRVSPSEERRCALDGIADDSQDVPIVFTLDRRRVTDLNDRRYLICSPQRRVDVASDSIVDVPAGPSTVTACGYVAWLIGLPPGQHALRTTAGDHTWSATVTVGGG